MNRVCRVWGKDQTGSRHEVAVIAGSKFEAAGLAIEQLRKQHNVDITECDIEVIVCDEKQRMLVRPIDLENWIVTGKRISRGNQELKLRLLQAKTAKNLIR